ncbi:MAG TPA: ABC transporter ATP-binding protein [Candidatus Dormibacteraeota bacterium]|jgi:putative ABC transport system ATP-binding protein
MSHDVVTSQIQLVNISKEYKGADRPALDEISLQICAGEFTAVMGPSGSGKSTLLNLIGGLDRPSSGELLVASVRLDTMKEAALARYRREKVGFVFQFFNLLGTLTAIENVAVAARLAGRSRREAERRARELLARMALVDHAQKLPEQLSGGERQRVALARALVNEPPVLLADEPTGALDSQTGEQVMELLADLNKDGQTIVMVTHDFGLANRYADRVIRLLDGRVVESSAHHSQEAASEKAFGFGVGG